MKTVADTIGVSRSNLAEQTRKHPLASPATRKPYAKPGDVAVLPIIRRLVDQPPTYGYRRITALLNRERQRPGLAAYQPQAGAAHQADQWPRADAPYRLPPGPKS
ncbi:hypothetical protein [Mesorhizobium sp. BHbdii]